MNKKSEEAIAELKDEMIAMGEIIKETINQSIKALKDQNLELAAEVIENDDKIDKLEMNLKEKCRELLSVSDLNDKQVRTLLVISETITDLERIGDHAENIAEMVEKIGVQPLIKPLIDIPRMKKLAIDILQNSLEVFINEDVEKAKSLARKDEQIDNLNEQVFRELITYMMENHAAIMQASSLILVSRYLERIGDHCTNICEGVIYMVSGKRESY